MTASDLHAAVQTLRGQPSVPGADSPYQATRRKAVATDWGPSDSAECIDWGTHLRDKEMSEPTVGEARMDQTSLVFSLGSKILR